jgi:hypothetical protein
MHLWQGLERKHATAATDAIDEACQMTPRMRTDIDDHIAGPKQARVLALKHLFEIDTA